jgi:excisionase family DNA binding protein
MYVKEAAEYLGLSKYLIRKMVKENKIPYSTTFRDVSFHKAILDAWMRGEFIPGKVALILDEECIEHAHRDALSEHYRRYPELLDQLKQKSEQNNPRRDEYSIEVRNDGVLLTVLSTDRSITTRILLTNNIIDDIMSAVKIHSSS